MNTQEKHSLALLQTPNLTAEYQSKLVTLLDCPTLSWQPPEMVTTASTVIWLNESGRLQLQETGKKKSGVISINFASGAIDYRRQYGGGKGQAIAKAIGLQDTKRSLNVLDCTAGLGRDAFVLATLGCRVTLLERSPVVAILLENGLKKAGEDSRISGIIQRMTLQLISAHDYLTSLSASATSEPVYDIIYLDPMFPHKHKSAAVKKEMQYLQTLLTGDDDAGLLLPLALQHARYRVVVKRPRIAPDLNDTPPSYRLEGKSNRFDVYTLRSLKQA